LAPDVAPRYRETPHPVNCFLVGFSCLSFLVAPFVFLGLAIAFRDTGWLYGIVAAIAAAYFAAIASAKLNLPPSRLAFAGCVTVKDVCQLLALSRH
jgi:hypothetical protein